VYHKRWWKGNPVLRDVTGPPCSWEIQYRDLALQAGGVSYETVIMATSYAGLGTKNDCAGKAQKHLYKYIIDSSSSQTGHLILRNSKLSKHNFNGRERRIGNGSHMAAWHQDRLADWL
jgi:hypothetical protein